MLLYKGKRQRSRKRYYLIQAILWVYTFIWLAALGACLYWYNELTLAYKLVFAIVLALGAPTPPKELFQTYNGYVEQWEEENYRE